MKNKFNIESATAEESIYLCVKIKEENEKNISIRHGELIENICRVIKNAEGSIIAGIVGYVYHNFKYLYIKSLWVNTAVRNRGYGTLLLENLENEAFKKGISFSHLDIFEFNSKDFYIKRGYEIFYVLEEAALNNKQYSMKKILNNNINYKEEEIIKKGTNDDEKYINDRLVEYDFSKVPFTNEEAVDFVDKVIKDDDRSIIAGVSASLSPWTDLAIEGLWINDNVKDKKLIKDALIDSVEEELKQRGGHLATIETFNDNEKDFYINHGYELCGVLDEYPEDYKSYYLKRLF